MPQTFARCLQHFYFSYLCTHKELVGIAQHDTQTLSFISASHGALKMRVGGPEGHGELVCPIGRVKEGIFFYIFMKMPAILC